MLTTEIQKSSFWRLSSCQRLQTQSCENYVKLLYCLVIILFEDLECGLQLNSRMFKIRSFPKTQIIQSTFNHCSFFTNLRHLHFLVVSYCHLLAGTYSCCCITSALTSFDLIWSHLLLLMCMLITIHEGNMTIWTRLIKVGPVYWYWSEMTAALFQNCES